MIYRTNLNDINITGRLGNQMWAIASAIGIAEKNHTECYFPAWNYQPYFISPLPHMDVDVFKGCLEYDEKSPYYCDIWLNPRTDWDLKGYFQSWKYFDTCKNRIKAQFETDIFDSNKVGYDTCAVHVRRGDYTNLQHIHPLLPQSYFERAIETFPQNTYFRFYSDDITWCIEHFRYFRPGYISFSLESSDIVAWAEMTKRSRHIIVSNSSYSWWAAYLKPFEDKIVIAPKIWVLNEYRDDRVPPEWNRI